MMEMYKYQGAGNDFIICDNRKGDFNPTAAGIAALCDRHYGVGADGLMLLQDEPGHDFKMIYYNPDGSGGMMCGNGGRCIAAFAADMGIRPANNDSYEFLCADGVHLAKVLAVNGAEKIVRLKMSDVGRVRNVDVKSYFLNTGARHFVTFVNSLESCSVVQEGRAIRNLPQFGPEGTNVNFVAADGDCLAVRTYEKGVEDETFACGTGITASAIAAPLYYAADPRKRENIGRSICHNQGRISINVHALRDDLTVDFIPTETGAKDVWLTGPATFAFKVLLPVDF